jgi:chromosome segregation ATPase
VNDDLFRRVPTCSGKHRSDVLAHNGSRIDYLEEENRRLEADNALLRRNVAEVRGERDRARTLAAALDAETMRLELIIAALHQRIHILTDDRTVDVRDEVSP